MFLFPGNDCLIPLLFFLEISIFERLTPLDAPVNTGFDPLSTLPADWKERVKGHLYPTGRSFREQANTPPTEVLPFLEKAAATQRRLRPV